MGLKLKQNDVLLHCESTQTKYIASSLSKELPSKVVMSGAKHFSHSLLFLLHVAAGSKPRGLYEPHWISARKLLSNVLNVKENIQETGPDHD